MYYSGIGAGFLDAVLETIEEIPGSIQIIILLVVVD